MSKFFEVERKPKPKKKTAAEREASTRRLNGPPMTELWKTFHAMAMANSKTRVIPKK